MQPFLYISTIVVLIFFTGALTYRAFFAASGLPLVFGWLWFNAFIALYEFYVVAKRSWFHSKHCPKDFWKEPVANGFWMKAWHEYTCQSDRRYLNPDASVFWMEFANAVLVIFLWGLFLTRQVRLLGIGLIAQFLLAMVYFGTLFQAPAVHLTNVLHWKLGAYLGISALWLIIPWLGIRELWRSK